MSEIEYFFFQDQAEFNRLYSDSLIYDFDTMEVDQNEAWKIRSQQEFNYSCFWFSGVLQLQHSCNCSTLFGKIIPDNGTLFPNHFKTHYAIPERKKSGKGWTIFYQPICKCLRNKGNKFPLFSCKNFSFILKNHDSNEWPYEWQKVSG